MINICKVCKNRNFEKDKIKRRFYSYTCEFCSKYAFTVKSGAVISETIFLDNLKLKDYRHGYIKLIYDTEEGEGLKLEYSLLKSFKFRHNIDVNDLDEFIKKYVGLL